MKSIGPGQCFSACLVRAASGWGLGFLALLNAWFLTAVDGPITNAGLPSTATFQEIKPRWDRVSPEDLRRAAEAGIPDAQFYYGGNEWRAAQRENTESVRWIIEGPLRGKVLTETEKAEFLAKWKDVPGTVIRRAAEQGDPAARFVMSKLESDRAFERAKQGFAWMKKAAEQSLRVAEEQMAIHYLGLESWLVIPTDINEGMKWLQRAADHGSEWAIHKQADFLLMGRFSAPNPAKALEPLRRAADLGCPRAKYQLALLYAQGDGEPRGPHETPVQLLHNAAQAGHPFAIASLAERHRTGLGVGQDWIRAIRLYHRADAIDAESDEWRGTRVRPILSLVDEKLELRRVTDPDIARFAEVLGLYRKATERRDAAAMYEIGQLYLRGANVPKDPVEAFKWFSEAARRGNAAAARSLDTLRTWLSADELERAHEPLEEFNPSGSSNRSRSHPVGRLP